MDLHPVGYIADSFSRLALAVPHTPRSSARDRAINIAVIKLIGNRYERDVSHRLLATIDRIETGSTHG